MKGFYTKKFLTKDIHKSLIYTYMDKLTLNSEEAYTNFQSYFNNDGEFIFVAVHPSGWGFDKFHAIEMIVNDQGVYVNGKKHEDFTKSYLTSLEIFKKTITNEYEK